MLVKLKNWLNIEIYYEGFNLKQESSSLREIPVVIMSSENVLPRIDRYELRITVSASSV